MLLCLFTLFNVQVVDDFSTGTYIHPNATYHRIDISVSDNIPKLREVFKDSSLIYHHAAIARVQPSFKDPIKYHRINATGTLNCLEAAKDLKKMRHFVYASTSSIYGNVNAAPSFMFKEGLYPKGDSPYAYLN